MLSIKVLLVRIGEEPVVVDVEPTLVGFRKLLGGNECEPTLEYLRLEENIRLVCDENGKLKKLLPNRWYPDPQNPGVTFDIILGDFFIVRISKGHQERSLKRDAIAKWAKHFALTHEKV